MAVVAVEELISGRGVSGRVRDSFKYTRAFLIQTDAPATSMVAIAQAPGVTFGQPHPDDNSVYAIEFDCQPEGSNPLYYKLSVTYGLAESSDTAADPDPGGGGGGGGGGGIQAPNFAGPPPDVWAGGVELSQVGTMVLPRQMDGQPEDVRNTAGVLFDAVTVEQARYTLTLSRSYTDKSFLSLLANNTNCCNSKAWAGCAAYTWLCKGGRWTRETQNNNGVNLMYYRVNWEFEFNPDKWTLVLNSMGYQELKNGKLVDIMNGDTPPKPVSEPQALAQNGAAASPGAAPAQVTYYPHKTIDFNALFGGVY